MITSKKELYKTKIVTKGKGEQIVKRLIELGVYCGRPTNFYDKNYLYVTASYELQYGDTDVYFRTSDFREIVIGDLLNTTIEVGDVITRKSWTLEPLHDTVISVEGDVVRTKTRSLSTKEYNDIIIVKKFVKEELNMSEYILRVDVSKGTSGGFHNGGISGNDFKWEDGHYGTRTFDVKENFVLLTRDKKCKLVSNYNKAEYTYLPVVEYSGNFDSQVMPTFKGLVTQPVVGKDVYTVPKEFILEGHKAACSTWQKKIEAQFPALFVKAPTHKIGDKFTSSGSTYILARANDGHAVLIDINTGSRWSSPKPTANSITITEDEFKAIAGGTTFMHLLTKKQ